MSPFFRHQQLSRFKLIIAHREGRRSRAVRQLQGGILVEEDGSGIILVEDVWHAPAETDEVGRGPFNGLMAAREWLADE